MEIYKIKKNPGPVSHCWFFMVEHLSNDHVLKISNFSGISDMTPISRSIYLKTKKQILLTYITSNI